MLNTFVNILQKNVFLLMPNMFIDVVFVFSLTSGGSRKKIFGGPGPSSFGKQLWLSEVTIEPI